MIAFFLIAAVLLIGALFFVLPPLMGKRLRRGEVSHGETNLSIYRDQLRELDADLGNGTLDRAQYESAKREIERRVLEESGGDEATAPGGGPQWTLAIAIAVAIPLIAISMYVVLGNPVALDASKVEAQAQAQGGHDMSPQRIAKMVDDLKARLAANPDDIEGWVMLAKSTQAIGRHDESVKAFRELVKRVGPDAQLLADFADVLAVANGRSLAGEPAALIEQALKIDPNNVKALALGGTMAFQQKDYAKAARLWRNILAQVPPESDFAQRIQGSIAEAESLGGIKSATPAARPAAAGTASAKAAAGGARLSGKVELDSAVAKSASPGDTVFVFARAASGPKMPLAVLRLKAADLPRAFELTEAMAMAPGMTIANFPDLVVGARLSKSGSATPSSGDWESELVPVKAGATGIALVVSRFVR
jgi:cytochrome c-type biogenesis protein CcmH